MEFVGIDPATTPIPIHPGQHYTMGGIDCTTECETIVKGFYAAGEAACVSVHGANRLGGNSLLDTIVFELSQAPTLPGMCRVLRVKRVRVLLMIH